jgi:hypothetical protein
VPARKAEPVGQREKRWTFAMNSLSFLQVSGKRPPGKKRIREEHHSKMV